MVGPPKVLLLMSSFALIVAPLPHSGCRHWPISAADLGGALATALVGMSVPFFAVVPKKTDRRREMIRSFRSRMLVDEAK